MSENVGEQPSKFAVESAVKAGSLSECVKSKRGAVVFRGGSLVGIGHNGQPAPFTCTGDARCRDACGKLCEHAEQIAIRDALVTLADCGQPDGYLSGCQLVHAKVVDDQLVAGGGLSCWQCSRLVLAVHLDGVWLYQLPNVAEANAAGVTDMYDPRFLKLSRWRYYTAEDFHRATLAACGMLP